MLRSTSGIEGNRMPSEIVDARWLSYYLEKLKSTVCISSAPTVTVATLVPILSCQASTS